MVRSSARGESGSRGWVDKDRFDMSVCLYVDIDTFNMLMFIVYNINFIC